VASKQVDPSRQDVEAIDKLIAERIKGSLDYWDGVTHQHAFGLPKFIRKAIANQTRVVTDANPLIVA
jgi:spermidine synthase